MMSFADMKPPDKTLQAWKELADVMEKHGFYFDMHKPWVGKGKRISLNMGSGGWYLTSASKRFTSSTLSEHVKNCELMNDESNWFSYDT